MIDELRNYRRVKFAQETRATLFDNVQKFHQGDSSLLVLSSDILHGFWILSWSGDINITRYSSREKVSGFPRKNL